MQNTNSKDQRDASQCMTDPKYNSKKEEAHIDKKTSGNIIEVHKMSLNDLPTHQKTKKIVKCSVADYENMQLSASQAPKSINRRVKFVQEAVKAPNNTSAPLRDKVKKESTVGLPKSRLSIVHEEDAWEELSNHNIDETSEPDQETEKLEDPRAQFLALQQKFDAPIKEMQDDKISKDEGNQKADMRVDQENLPRVDPAGNAREE